MGHKLFTLFALCLLPCVYTLIMCDEPGETCIDHEQCCGGCCIEGVCIDTYRSCLNPYDVCHDHICMGEETCVVFVPPECPGCQPVPLCQIL